MSARTGTIDITGHAADDAEARITTAGQWLLRLDVELPPTPGSGKIVLARLVQRFGEGLAAGIACRMRARELRRGVRISARGLGVRIRGGRIEIEPLGGILAPDLDMRTLKRYDTGSTTVDVEATK